MEKADMLYASNISTTQSNAADWEPLALFRRILGNVLS